MQKKLNSSYYAMPKAEPWTFAAVPNLYMPSRYKHSLDTNGCNISLVSVEKKIMGKGQHATHEVLRFHAADPEELREKIKAAFPQAVFTQENPEPHDLKAEYQAQRKAEQDRQFAAQEQQDFNRRVIEQHRLLASRMTPAEQTKHTNTNLNWLETSPESPYCDFFRQHPQFLTYPDNSNRNHTTLLRWCEQRGYAIPLHAELCEGMTYLLEHGHFHMKPNFKRSERDELRAVREFAQEDPASKRFSPELIADATRQLRAALPVGSVPSMEVIEARAKELGISEQLLEVILHGQEQTRADVRGKSTAELKSGLQTMRNSARPQTERAEQISAERAKTMPIDELKKEMRKTFRIPNTVKGY